MIEVGMTKGWKRYPVYKDSGVEWLGEIPEYWEVLKLKFLTHLFYGVSLANDLREEGNIEIYGSNGAIGKHNISNTSSPCIIVGRKGSCGKIAFSINPVFAIDTTYFIDKKTQKTQFNLRWLFYSLSILELDKSSQDTGVPGLSREFAYNKLLAVPPLREQQAIAHFLDRETTTLDTLIAKTQTSIAKIKEYRTALISAGVTGQIDVREFQKTTVDC